MGEPRVQKTLPLQIAELVWGYLAIVGLLLFTGLILLGGVLVILFTVDAILFGEPTLSGPVLDALIAVLDWLGDLVFAWVP